MMLMFVERMINVLMFLFRSYDLERPVTERMSGTDRQTDTWQATTALVDRCWFSQNTVMERWQVHHIYFYPYANITLDMLILF